MQNIVSESINRYVGYKRNSHDTMCVRGGRGEEGGDSGRIFAIETDSTYK